MDTSTIFIVILVILPFYFIYIYNRLVALRNRFKNAFAQIDVQLTRRHELIPNLVETAKAYLKHERETLDAVISARNSAASAAKAAAAHPESGAAIASLAAAEGLLGSSLGQFYAVMENYPELKADVTITNLMEELKSTENRVSFARQAFNDAVMEYNTHRESFPNNFIAIPFNFQEAQLLVLENPEYRQPLKVSF